MTERGRFLPMATRSCGFVSPPDHYRQPSAKRTCCRGNGKFGIPSSSYLASQIVSKQYQLEKNQEPASHEKKKNRNQVVRLLHSLYKLGDSNEQLM